MVVFLTKHTQVPIPILVYRIFLLFARFTCLMLALLKNGNMINLWRLAVKHAGMPNNKVSCDARASIVKSNQQE